MQQEEDATIESQIANLEKYAHEREYELCQEHYFLDQGVSGSLLDRPSLNRLRNLAVERKFEVVLCYSPDRLSRKSVHQWLLMDELKRLGVEIEFSTQPERIEGPHGDLLLGIQGLFAEYERAQITERFRRGKLYRMKNGELASPNPPYGYHYIPVSEPDGGRWAIEPSEAEGVRLIYALYTEQEQTISQIVNRLSQNPIETPPRRGRWTYSTVQSILSQPAYTGTAYFNRTRTLPESVGRTRKNGHGPLRTPEHEMRPESEWIEIPVPPILSQSLWDHAQEILSTNKQFSPRNNKKHFYLLRGLLTCHVCGRILIARNSAGNAYYYCSNGGKNRMPDVEQHSCSVPGHIIEPLVWQQVQTLLHNPHLIADAWHSQLPDPLSSQDELERLQHRLRQVDSQWARLLDAFQDGLIDKVQLALRKEKLDSTRSTLLDKIDSLQLEHRRFEAKEQMIQDFQLFSQKISTSLHDPSPQTKQEVIRLVIDHILVQQHSVIIKHIIPTDDDCRLLPGHR